MNRPPAVLTVVEVGGSHAAEVGGKSNAHRKGTFKIAMPFEDALKVVAHAKPQRKPHKPSKQVAMLALQLDLPSTASALPWWEWFLFATVLGILALLSYSTLEGGKKALGGIIAVIIFLASIGCAVLGILRWLQSVPT